MTSFPRKEAVALGYDQSSESAPRVLAKGKGIIAENIILKAAENGVAIQEDESLLALLGKIDVGESIPEELYGAVAEVFAFVYKLDKEIGKRKT
ncbi:hypothetical protein AS034_10295 [[Bacillus] enclensis]|jgi:flagellar biosynthesis protein|uniref:Flagellar biosynthesis protein n=2 Tax=Rossellomorea TaxID=2837508 RepID=A0A0V8HJB3_9BACI|nr:EscU/YscU/HrcU family type III secretion system export apparatus switch protein [[Bacillus] enclensis]OAT82857.1 hypothetical protein A6P54_10025 [Bacillus sp. MKU004]QTC42392.1 EscU/YscU/HrcU family type III secretion system export apparatus switch protein [Bacillus sp. V3]QWC24458.1 EscU/YscU/HrcU family type III secretion system export apparatus switch protein [Bacillus haikouensis]KSU62498.1 hypothetical protein AS034_10295 [[Bacillus] enclensis]MBH9965496.1 EscU/YscU/HrcU family type I